MADNNTINVSVNCPYLNQMIMNEKQVVICTKLKIDISSNIGEYCVGNKCPIPKIG